VGAVQLRAEGPPSIRRRRLPFVAPIVPTSSDRLDVDAVIAGLKEEEQPAGSLTSTPAASVARLERVFGKARSKRKANTQSVAFAECNQVFMAEITSDIKRTKFVLEDLFMPAKYLDMIEEQFTSQVTTMNVPFF
jgi:hypothetical protein